MSLADRPEERKNCAANRRLWLGVFSVIFQDALITRCHLPVIRSGKTSSMRGFSLLEHVTSFTESEFRHSIFMDYI